MKMRSFLWALVILSCKSPPEFMQPDTVNETLKYPLILVHGIVAHDRNSSIDFWGRIPARLQQKNVAVFFGNTDAWGSVESNAHILKNTLDRVLQETNAEKVNIIAHSKGGIDSRYMIWKYDCGDKVASLTTIATPHHGSEIADLIFERKIVHTGIVKKALDVFGKLYGDVNPDIYNVNYQLTRNKMKEFNGTVAMDERVYYQSRYTTLRSPWDDVMMFYPYLYLKITSGPSDGFISERSVNWGNNVVKMEGRISHADILDYKKRKISGIDVPDIYINIVDGLIEKGF